MEDGRSRLDEYFQDLGFERPEDPLVISAKDIVRGVGSGLDTAVPADWLRVENWWQEVVGDQVWIAYAGTDSNDEMTGVVVVRRMSIDGKADFGWERFVSPIPGGRLRIQKADGGQLEMQNELGISIRFSPFSGLWEAR